MEKKLLSRLYHNGKFLKVQLSALAAVQCSEDAKDPQDKN